MKIELKPYDNFIKNTFEIIPNALDFNILKNLGYFQFKTWKGLATGINNKRYLFKIFADNKFSGVIGLNYIKDKKYWNLSYFIFKKHWNKGIGTIATKKILNFASRKKIKKIYTETFKSNIGSTRILEKNGFKKVKEDNREI